MFTGTTSTPITRSTSTAAPPDNDKLIVERGVFGRACDKCNINGYKHEKTLRTHLEKKHVNDLGRDGYFPICNWPGCGEVSTNLNSAIDHIIGKHTNGSIHRQSERTVGDQSLSIVAGVSTPGSSPALFHISQGVHRGSPYQGNDQGFHGRDPRQYHGHETSVHLGRFYEHPVMQPTPTYPQYEAPAPMPGHLTPRHPYGGAGVYGDPYYPHTTR